MLGAVVWMVTMGSAPRYAQGPDIDTGNPLALALGLGAVALVLGLLGPKRPLLVGALVTAGPLLLAPVTAPRGDGDGLWILIFPMLVFLGGGTTLACQIGATLRLAWTRRHDPPHSG